MNHNQPATAKAARRTRSAFSRRAVRAAAVAGMMTLAAGTAGTAFAATGIAPHSYVPSEECLTWSGTVNYFPALTTTSHAVTAVVNGTLSNCNLNGTGQTFSGTVFGELTGTATKGAAKLTGNLAVTWPSDANAPTGLSPTISPVSITSASGTYNIVGTISAGAGTGEQLWGSYAKTGQSAVPGGTSEHILGSKPFGIFHNNG
jgi:hypothetical protein